MRGSLVISLLKHPNLEMVLFIHVVGILLDIVTPSILTVGIAVIIQKKFGKIDSSSLCPYVAIPFALLCIPMIWVHGTEAYQILSSGDKYEADAFSLRIIQGPYWISFWASLIGLLASQLFWIRAIRNSPIALAIIGFFTLLGGRF